MLEEWIKKKASSPFSTMSSSLPSHASQRCSVFVLQYRGVEWKKKKKKKLGEGGGRGEGETKKEAGVEKKTTKKIFSQSTPRAPILLIRNPILARARRPLVRRGEVRVGRLLLLRRRNRRSRRRSKGRSRRRGKRRRSRGSRRRKRRPLLARRAHVRRQLRRRRRARVLRRVLEQEIRVGEAPEAARRLVDGPALGGVHVFGLAHEVAGSRPAVELAQELVKERRARDCQLVGPDGLGFLPPHDPVVPYLDGSRKKNR